MSNKLQVKKCSQLKMISSNRPYLIRALYEWLVDNGLTPHLLVEAEGAGVVVPTQYAEDGWIVLNIGLSAVHDLELGNDYITFNARFGGSPMVVVVPPSAVLRIYARENGRGMLFPDEEYQDGDETPPDNDPEPMLPKERPKLKVVK